jgi:microcystin-dependent protein
MSVKISELNQLANPAKTSVFPVVVGGATRRATIQDLLGSVTGGTVTSLQAVGNIKTSPSPLTTSGSIFFDLPGMIMSYAGTSAPSGWVFCNGQSFSTLDPVYSNLYSVIGTTYGSGAGTFKVPDLRGRIPFGVASSASEVNRLTGASVTPNLYTLGATGGSEAHTLTDQQTAIRTHFHSGTGKKRIYGDTTTHGSDGKCYNPGQYSDYRVPGNIREGVATTAGSKSLDLFNREASTTSLSSSTNPYEQTLSADNRNKTNQTITWTQSFDSTLLPGTQITLTATASSSLPVLFTVHSGSATIAGNELTINGPGIIVIEAYQAGDATYDPVYFARSITCTPFPHNNMPPSIVLNYIIKV